ncbi:sensor histidine kinase [Aliarcobacter lanthieri]|uniref:sensor histidine kinase n=1 Tax=Aliarcobacter lanthieri TaxID=1355374 RepID=UPI003AB0C1B9
MNYKDKFIEHSVHEIKTPLSIINLNIQLRNKNLGEDKYSKKIEGAVKTLKNSYEDIAFLHTKNKIDYKIEKLNLSKILKDRVNYFEIIAKTQFRQFNLEIIEDYDTFMSEIELIRLIDNNLSNAIKYSTKNSTINISLKNKTLEFQSFGNTIRNCKKIFHRFTRENESSGGHGLGLSIVKDICDKYKIDINVNSKDGINIFSYRFNCHKFDTN